MRLRPWAASAFLLVPLAGVWSGPLHAQAVLQPPRLDGTNVTVQWNSGGAIQVATAVTGPWITLTEGVNTVSTAATRLAGPAQFFRVVENGRPGEPMPVLPQGLGTMPEIESAFLQRLAQPAHDGNSRLAVRFAEGAVPRSFSNSVPIFLHNRLSFLNDRGQFPDATANDGVFSMVLDVNTNDIQAANTRLSQMPATRQFTRQFIDRQVRGTNIPLTAFPLSNFLAGTSIPLLNTNLFGKIKVNCPAGSPLAYDWRKTLMITHLSVVQDNARTWDPCPAPAGTGTKMGVWTFGTLMSNICNEAATGVDPADFTREFMRAWEFDQTINSDVVPARAAIRAQVVNNWLAQSALNGLPPGKLDLAIAPFRLCAIVNRVDLRSNTGFTYGGGPSASNPCEPVCRAGEARFVFCAVDVANGCSSLPFLIIFEYCAPGDTCEEIRAWGAQWAALDGLAFGPAYNAALQNITTQFTSKNSAPSRPPNKSAINQIRSNEIDILPWELREFRLSAHGFDAGFLRETTVVNTPDFDLNNLAVIKDFVATPMSSVPKIFQFNPFLGGTAPAPAVWNGLPAASGLAERAAMHKFGLNTCNGCHTTETGTAFTHVGCREFGSFVEAPLSGFLTGISGVPDPRSPALAGVGPYSFADLDRRVIDLDELVNCPCNPFHLIAQPLSIAVNPRMRIPMAH